MNEKHQFIIPAIIFAVVVSVVGVFWAVQGANQLTSSGLMATSAAIGTGAVMGADGTLTTTGGAILNTSGATNGLIVSSGNVGIGTTDPGVKLHTYGVDPEIRAETSSAGGDSNISLKNPSQQWNWALQGASSDFILRDVTGGTTPFTVENTAPSNSIYVKATSGNVGIGTTNPGSFKLAVNGQVRANDLIGSDNLRIAGSGNDKHVAILGGGGTSPSENEGAAIYVRGRWDSLGPILQVFTPNTSAVAVERFRIESGDNPDISFNNIDEIKISGGLKIGGTSATCNASNAGRLEFGNGKFYGCDGTNWLPLTYSAPCSGRCF